ncbi:MAG: rhodanese-like domain-containing protein [Polyangiaceae bacterium]|nr:rhodanese-like domain-containing protein [Polyangiaceae bacterium]
MKNISARELHELLRRGDGDVDVVDVREPAEWVTGHIEGSRLVPLASLRANPKGSLPRDGIVFVCAAGIRSQNAARIALGNGYGRVYNLVGGTRAWQSAGLPLVQDGLSVAV